MRTTPTLLITALFFVGCGRGTQPTQPLTEELARRLVIEAAAADPEVYHAVLRVEGGDLEHHDQLPAMLDATCSLSMVFVAALPRVKLSRFTDEDLRLEGKPHDYFPYLLALDPQHAEEGRLVPDNPRVSVLREDTIRSIIVEQSGQEAEGEVRFRIPEVCEGRVHYKARFDGAAWSVTEFHLPSSMVILRPEGGVWRVVRSTIDMWRYGPDFQVWGTPVVRTVWRAPCPSRVVDAAQVGRNELRCCGWPINLDVSPEEASRVSSGVRDSLWRLAEETGFAPDYTSLLAVRLRAHCDMEWRLAERLVALCARANPVIRMVLIAAVSSEDGFEGNLPFLLPADRGIQTSRTFVEDAPFPFRVKLFRKNADDWDRAFTLIRLENRLSFELPVAWRGHLRETEERIAERDAILDQLRVALAETIAAKGGLRPDACVDLVIPPPRRSTVPLDDVASVLSTLLEVGLFANVGVSEAEHLLGRSIAEATRLGAEAEALALADHAAPDEDDEPSDERRIDLDASDLEVGLEEDDEADLDEPETVVEEDVAADREGTGDDPELDLPYEESTSEEGLSDAPFSGPANNGLIGLGGGAGGAFGDRGGSRHVGGGGGDRRTQDAVEDALKWLAAHQSPSGGWQAAEFHRWCDGKPASQGPDGAGSGLYDPGVTGLSLCAFLGAGYTNRGRHPFAKTVSKGLRYLKNVQDAEGCFGPRTSQHFIYNHATAALAMVEAYGMTGSPMFKGSAQKALNFIALARNPDFAWRYGVKPGDNDTSITGWMLLALNSARLVNEDAVRRGKTAPLRVDEGAFEGTLRWIDKVTDRESGRTGYIQRGGSSSRPKDLYDEFPSEKCESMTGIGILARIVLEEDARRSEMVRKGAKLCTALPPTWNTTDGSIDMYYWHFAALALFQVGESAWTPWKRELERALLDSQRDDTTHCQYKGSWDPLGPWGGDGGRVYATAILALCLETPSRYPRIGSTPGE